MMDIGDRDDGRDGLVKWPFYLSALFIFVLIFIFYLEKACILFILLFVIFLFFILVFIFTGIFINLCFVGYEFYVLQSFAIAARCCSLRY